jgi:hypothetical protein
MNKKVKRHGEAMQVFHLLGIKDVTKEWQRKKGTQVFELPLKTMYYNGHAEINRFSVYKSGYVRKMIIGGKNNASMSCYQLNKVRKVAYFVKDYEWDESKDKHIWTGKYHKVYSNERVMIDSHADRVVYLCNYILKNYYRKKNMNLVGEYTMERVSTVHGEWWRNERKSSLNSGQDVQVIINGHRYNLS